MGYSGVKGGMDAILAAERLVRRKRAAAPWSPTAAIIETYRLAVDRVMGEAGLYDEAIAADAFRQAEGDLLEAANLVRAYRSSLPRLAISTPADPDEMTVLRRIVPASRTPNGPQLLGRTTDYTARVLERPDGPVLASAFAEPAAAGTRAACSDPDELRHPRRFYEQLLEERSRRRARGTGRRPRALRRRPGSRADARAALGGAREHGAWRDGRARRAVVPVHARPGRRVPRDHRSARCGTAGSRSVSRTR